MHVNKPDSRLLLARPLGHRHGSFFWNFRLLILCLMALAALDARAQSTAFTYQGRLTSSSGAATGLYDIRFTLYDSLTAGGIVGGPVVNTAVVVSNGLFTTTVDLGNAFSGGGRWLEISVRLNGTVDFTSLSPRQAINSAPYAIRAGAVADGVITASKLAPGVGANGQVLKLNGAALAWGTDLNSGGTVTSVNAGSGLTGGPITTSGSLSIDTAIVPRLAAANTFTASNTFNAGNSLLNPANQFAGTFFGNGAGLTNLSGSSLNGDVTGTASANTVARIRGVNVAVTAPAANQLLRYNGSAWTPAPLSLATDVSGTLPLANGGTGAATAPAARTALGAAASGANSDITSLLGLTTPMGIAQGGTGAGTAPAARTALGAAASGANSDITSLLGLTSPIGVSQGGVGHSSYAIGDILYASAPTTLSRLADVVAGNALISGGVGVAPLWGKIGLGTHVSGTLGTANGGTGATTPATARTALGAAGSGVNSDITSITGLTVPLPVSQGGVGISSYTVGDLLFANSATSLARLPDSASGNVLLSGGIAVPPGWGKVNLGAHVAGALPIINGGTGGGTPLAARTNIGAAASGPNTDITSLGGLTTPISPAQGGSGNSSYALGDILYASGSATLSRRAAGSAGQVLTISGGFPAWGNANAHNHFGQSWSSSGIDGIFIQNTSVADGASAITGSSTTTNLGTGPKYGVYGQSLAPNGVGVQGTAFGTNGLTTGIGGEAVSPDGTGVYGLASSGSGTPIGVYGEAFSTNGIGVYGSGSASTGVPVGVYGVAGSPNGYGLYTPNRLFVGDVSFFGDHISLQTTARLFANNGSAAAPTISFTSSPGVGLYSPGANVLGLSSSGVERMRIAADGRVGIGRVPTANQLEVAGEASKTTAGSWVANSDARIKTEVRPLNQALEKISQVRPVSFRYKEEYRQTHPEIEDKQYVNVIAQEFAKVFPEAVKQSGESFQGEPISQVDTYPATIYAISAIQELHGLLKNRDAEVAELREQNANLEKRLRALEQAAGLISKAAR